jgi:hypothetical protein
MIIGRDTPLIQDARSAFEGAYDLHAHTAPDSHYSDRWYDDLTYCREASTAGMAGAVLKNHYTYTGDRAWLCREFVPEFHAFGGLCLDAAVGGLNPWAVDAAARSSDRLLRVIWFPTISAKSYPNRKPDFAGPGVDILDEDGRLLPEVYEIFDILKGTTCAISTGHLSYPEQLTLVKEAHSHGIERIFVTHADAPYLKLGPDEQKELSRYALLEHAAMHFLTKPGTTTVESVIAGIRATGVERCILSTDLGQDYNPDPIRGLFGFCLGLLKNGFAIDELRRMTHENPRELLSD